MSEELINLGGAGDAVPKEAIVSKDSSVGDAEKVSLDDKAGWLSKVADESLRGNKTLSRYSTLEEALHGHVELRSTVGRDVYPNADTTEEQLADHWRKSGIPAADKYSFDAAKYGVDDALALEIKAIASESGVTENGIAKIFDKLVAFEGNQNEGAQEAYKAKLDTQVEGLKSEYGDSFDKYSKLAGQVAAEVYTEAEITELKEEGFFSNPMVVKALMNMAKTRFGEELISDTHTKRGFAVGAEQAEARMSEIMDDKAYYDKQDPRHKTLLKQAEDLQKVISAG